MRKMKDSGIEWIGEIPEGWEVIPIKYLARYNYDTLTESCSPDFEFNYIDIGSVTYGKGITTFQKFKFKDSPSRARRVVTPGDILISTVRTYLRAIACVNKSSIPQIASTGFLVLQADISKIHPHFLMYSVLSDNFICKVEANSVGISYPAINASQIVHFKLPIPQLSEQFLLVTYLDRQCSEIDALLSKTLSSIEEYKKLKQAVITQAVTKGVCGEREMKDSGVDWIGEIPEEWNKCKLKNISIDIGDGLHGTPKFDDSGEVYFINGNNFSSEYVEPKFDTKKLCLEESLNYPKPELTEQTIMISLNGSYGKVCLYRYFPMLLGKSAGYITLLPSINRRYVRYYLSSTPAQIIMTLSLNGTTIPNLSLNTLYNFPTILPPASEQAEIADYLDTKCAEIDGLIAKKEQLVKELESYKKSLIYEVVTGKREV